MTSRNGSGAVRQSQDPVWSDAKEVFWNANWTQTSNPFVQNCSIKPPLHETQKQLLGVQSTLLF